MKFIQPLWMLADAFLSEDGTLDGQVLYLPSRLFDLVSEDAKSHMPPTTTAAELEKVKSEVTMGHRSGGSLIFRRMVEQ